MAYGDGNIYQRDDSPFYWMRWFEGGDERRQSTGKTDRKAALHELRQKVAMAMRNRRLETVAQAFGLLFKDYERRNLGLYDLKMRVEKNLLPFWGKLSPDKVTPALVAAYIDKRREAEVADATIARELANLRRALTLAYHEGLTGPPPHIQSLKVDNARQGFVTESEFDRLIAHAQDHIRCVIAIAYHVGCRRGELLKLRWDQVDWQANELRLDSLRQTKNRERRTLPMYGSMAAELARHRAYIDRRPKGREDKSADERKYVFCFEGKRLNTFPKAWVEVTTAADLCGLIFHDLRRSAVRNMERAGVPRPVAMAITGHKTESIYRRYDIVSTRDLQEAANRLNSYRESEKTKNPHETCTFLESPPLKQ